VVFPDICKFRGPGSGIKVGILELIGSTSKGHWCVLGDGISTFRKHGVCLQETILTNALIDSPQDVLKL
jgi:hypothetical protein